MPRICATPTLLGYLCAALCYENPIGARDESLYGASRKRRSLLEFSSPHLIRRGDGDAD
jgi:hypothetical protein